MKNPKCMVVSKCLCISLAHGFPLGLRGPIRGAKVLLLLLLCGGGVGGVEVFVSKE